MNIFKPITACFLSAVFTFGAAAWAAADDGGEVYLQNFENVTTVSECPEITNASNSSKGITSKIENGTLVYSKAGTKAHTMYVSLNGYLDGIDSYMVELDLGAKFAKNKSFILRCGTNIQLVSQGDGSYVIQCLEDSKFVTGNSSKFDFSNAGKIAFVIRNTENEKTVDIYTESEGGDLLLVYEKLEYIETSATPEKTLGFTFNASSDGEMVIDNICAATTLPVKHDITKLEFVNIGDSLTVDAGEIIKIPINAEAKSGIARIDIYYDGDFVRSLTESPYMLDLQDINKKSTTIKAAAVSNDGDEREISLVVKQVNSDSTFSIFEDSEFTEGDANVLDSGISMYPRRGFVKAEQVDVKYGDSLLVGVDTPNTSYAAAEIPYIDVPLKSSAGRISIDYDLYVDTQESSGKKTMVLRMSNDKETNIVRFTGSEMKILNKLVIAYEEHKWYHFSIKADTVQNTISVFADGVPLLCDEVLHSTNTKGDLGLKLFRLYGPAEQADQGFIAIDNIKVTGYYDIPTVTEVAVLSNRKEIAARLSAPVYGSSITTDTVSLIDENGAECRIADVAYDSGANTVIIKTEKALLADLDYRVVISADAKLTEDIMIGEEVSADFRTAPNDISVTAAEISPDAEECTARVSVKNTSEENKTVYVAMTLWNKNRGVDMRIMPIAIEAKAVKSVTLRAERQDADAAEIYVYSDMMASEFLSSRIYRKEF